MLLLELAYNQFGATAFIQGTKSGLLNDDSNAKRLLTMIANLPLLFAGGNPTSLTKMSTHELECFITFLVHCSWGHDTAKLIQQPPWWPAKVPFSDPFSRPKALPDDWSTSLRDLIKQCYTYHSSEFLLKFSEELARNPPSTLQYVDNCDRTTSLYQRSSGRLLVTFRNENMLYDRKIDGICRKSLLPKRQNASESMVEQVIADIYLCDTCDEVFDNLEDVRKHERQCSQRPSTPEISPLTPEPHQKQEVEQDEFMSLLGLQTVLSDKPTSAPTNEQENTHLNQFTHRQRRSTVFNYLSCFPFSSLAGRRLNNGRNRTNESDLRLREHLDRYCSAPPLCLETPKWLNKPRTHNFPSKYKRTENYWNRHHVFPRQTNKLILDLKSQLLFLNCKPLSVQLKRLSSEDIKQYLDSLELESDPTVDSCYDHEIEFVSVSVCDPVTRTTLKKSPLGKRRLTNVVKADAMQIDIIDLCSDDDESLGSENAIPFPVACHASGEMISRAATVAATPEFDHSTEPDSQLEAAHYPPTVKGKSQCTNSQVTRILQKKLGKPIPLKEFHVNLYSPKESNVISID